jgi:Clp amino terminal domain, pathogenicity island component
LTYVILSSLSLTYYPGIVGNPDPFDFAALIEAVEARRAAGALAGIEQAVTVAGELGALSDRLIGYYAERARAEGCTWAQIGAAIGISRQAAQQRFGTRAAALGLPDLEQAGGLQRLAPRARDALFTAERHARQLRHPALSPAHLLLAILEDPANLATRAIEAAGASTAELTRQVRDELSPQPGPEPAALPLDPATRRALAGALTEALHLGHNYVGTEHLLLGLLRDPAGRAAQLLARHGADAPGIRQQVTSLINDYLRRKS